VAENIAALSCSANAEEGFGSYQGLIVELNAAREIFLPQVSYIWRGTVIEREVRYGVPSKYMVSGGEMA
jgi:hypothetical protein